MAVFQEMSRLVNELNRHCLDYYKGDPQISNEAYDAMFLTLKKLEAEHPKEILPYSPTQKVGAPVEGEFEKYTRQKPMLSLDNVFSIEELDKWLKGLPVQVTELSVEFKLDGLALELIYMHGHLVNAVTRGDGVTGDSVIDAAKTIRNIPLFIPSLEHEEQFSVIGECVILTKDFNAINAEMIENKVKPFANARNAAAGGLRTLDPSKASLRRLTFIAYETDAYPLYEDLWERLSKLSTDGFTVSTAPMGTFERKDVLNEVASRLEQIRAGRTMCGVDGLVIKVTDSKHRNTIGFTGHHPKWAIAYKDAPDQAESTIQSIELQVGRTGVVTPVAKIEPTEVGGVVVSSVTLHNFDHIKEKAIRVGGTITLHRAGEVIPQILTCIGGKDFPEPTECPCCGTKLERDGAFLRCPAGFDCKEQLTRYLQHYVSRPAMNIIGLAKEYVRSLVESELVNKPYDLYTLYKTPAEVAKAMGLTMYQVDKLFKAIHASCNTNLARFIFSLGILEVGSSTAKNLAHHFGTLNAFMAATPEQLKEVDDVGDVVAANIHNFFNEHTNADDTVKLYENLNVLLPKRRVKLDVADRKTFVITGSFQDLAREKLKEDLMSLGHKVTGSVSKNTSILIAGENAGGKLAKAEKLKVEVWDEVKIKEFLRSPEHVAT